MKSIIRWFVHAASIYFAAWLIPGIEISSFWTALWVSVIMAVVNFFLKPLLTIISLPLIVITFGLFLIVINAVLLLVAGEIAPGFEVNGFWPAVLGSLVISLVSYVLNPPKKKEENQRA
ncbi:MAG: phage holin family protein [Bacteroidia bacterium]|nr:phage holin family protein [Bacteroidia bacterium]